MKAMVLDKIQKVEADANPLKLVEKEIPSPSHDQILVRVVTCGVCHTELDEIEGRMAPAHLPVVPGHQVVGVVEALGESVQTRKRGERVGIGWIFSSCGKCRYCLNGNDNLCAEFQATGRDADGGYAEYIAVPAGSAHLMPAGLSEAEAAPLLCAGAIGYRSIRLSGVKEGQALGLTGFGASAHLVLKTIRHILTGIRVYVFSRSPAEQEFAKELGAVWSGGIEDHSPEPLQAIIDTTPVWRPVLAALRNLAPGGRLVINAIRKETYDLASLLELDYAAHLWMEKEIKSVANVSNKDIADFLRIADEAQIKPEYQEYGLREANQALLALRMGQIRGAKVLRIA